MEIQKYLAGMKRKYEIILNFINKDNPTEKEFQEVRDLHQSNDFYKIQDLIETFRLIMSISNNHHRNSSFFANIEKIILYYKKEIQKHFSNTEIFDLFASNKKILLFLLKEKIITFDKYIFNTLNNFKYAQLGYKYYFSPELNLFHYSVPDEEHIEHAIEDHEIN